MSLPRLGAARARQLAERFPSLTVLVVGDVMLDRFIVGRVTRISPEAPVPIVRFHGEHVRAGGAANVASNIAALGGRVALVGVVGADAAADELRRRLADGGVAADGLVEDPPRRTTEKVRVVTERNQQVARIDYEDDSDVGPGIEQAIVAAIVRLGRHADALLVSDYLKGAITRPIVEALLAVARPVGRFSRSPPTAAPGRNQARRSSSTRRFRILPVMQAPRSSRPITMKRKSRRTAASGRTRKRATPRATSDTGRPAPRRSSRAANTACGCRATRPTRPFPP
jgi:hypothetical protein